MEDEQTAEPRTVAPRRFRWIRAADDRVPTKWLAGIGTAVFLAVTAAFGGLATVPAPDIPVLAAGDEHRSEQLAVTVDRAVLIDDFDEAGIYVEPGERVLALVVDVENLWTEPLPTTTGFSVSSTIRVTGAKGSEPASVARFDDATLAPRLQPGVAARLVLTWPVDDDRFADGDMLSIVLSDETLYTGTSVLSGQYWDDPVKTAVVEVAIEDVGAGADAEEGS